MDEISSWTVYLFLKTAGVTSRMEIRYRKSINIDDGELRIVGKLIKVEKRLAYIGTKILNNKSEICAEATIQFFTYPENIAREKLNLPGYEAFFF
jgi:acyl-CoA thioesterase FadM